jgi:Helix-turn-helix domain
MPSGTDIMPRAKSQRIDRSRSPSDAVPAGNENSTLYLQAPKPVPIPVADGGDPKTVLRDAFSNQTRSERRVDLLNYSPGGKHVPAVGIVELEIRFNNLLKSCANPHDIFRAALTFLKEQVVFTQNVCLRVLWKDHLQHLDVICDRASEEDRVQISSYAGGNPQAKDTIIGLAARLELPILDGDQKNNTFNPRNVNAAKVDGRAKDDGSIITVPVVLPTADKDDTLAHIQFSACRFPSARRGQDHLNYFGPVQVAVIEHLLEIARNTYLARTCLIFKNRVCNIAAIDPGKTNNIQLLIDLVHAIPPELERSEAFFIARTDGDIGMPIALPNPNRVVGSIAGPRPGQELLLPDIVPETASYLTAALDGRGRRGEPDLLKWEVALQNPNPATPPPKARRAPVPADWVPGRRLLVVPLQFDGVGPTQFGFLWIEIENEGPVPVETIDRLRVNLAQSPLLKDCLVSNVVNVPEYYRPPEFAFSKPTLNMEICIERAIMFPNLPVLISGEKAVGKSLVARHIARGSRENWGHPAVDPVPYLILPRTAPEIALSYLDAEGASARSVIMMGIEQYRENRELADAIGRRLHTLRTAATAGRRPNLQIIALQVMEAGPSPVNSTVDEIVEYIDACNGLKITVPPIRERKPEIVHIVDHWLRREGSIGNEFPHRAIFLKDEDQIANIVRQHEWPGNFQELHGYFRQACLNEDYRLRKERPDAKEIVLTGQALIDASNGVLMPARERDRTWILGEAARLHAEGMSYKAIAKKLDTSHSTLTYWVRQAANKPADATRTG